MERKIMSLGRSSLVVSLPKHWIQLNGLKRGDVVSLAVQRDRSLVIFPSAERKEESKEITLYVETNEGETSIVRKIIGCYLNGYFIIRMVSRNIFSVPQRKAIRNIVRMLYMRILESDAKSMLIQTLIDESKASLELAIKRMFSISQSMCVDALNSLKNRDVMLAKAVYSLDDDVDHFSFFILRLLRNAAQDSVIANEFGIDSLDCMDYQTFIYRIEHAADYSSNISKHVILLDESRQKIPDDILSLMFAAGTEAVNSYAKAVNAFFSKDVNASNEVLEHQRKIEKMDQEIASKAFMSRQKNAQTICAICSIREDIKKIADCAADIAEIVINRVYKMAI
ncbi:MAG: PhoU domain-containing protein [Candidatus Bathycorpusculaceae bacterium]